MIVTRQDVADKIAAYLQHELSLDHLVRWAQRATLDGQIEGHGYMDVRDALARLGLADSRSFNLTWEDCEHLLQRLGYTARVEIQAV